MSLLEVKNLSIAVKTGGNGFAQGSFSRSLFNAVNETCFTIDAGEIVGLAGESGCGKTLTALSISGLLPPAAAVSGGDILFNAHNTAEPLNLAALDEEAFCRLRGRDISMIFQEPRQSLNPLMRAGDQIAEVPLLHGLMRKKEAKTAALDMLAALGFAEPQKIFRSFPYQLSGGMCQRVMIALAAICRPKLLVADEPSTALDSAAQSQILSLLAGINRDFGTAVFFISHDLSLVRRFCRRFLVMYAGRIVEEGPAEAVFSLPAHPYTRLLAGAIPGREHRGKPLANIPGRAPFIEEKLPGCPFAPRCPRRAEQCTAAFPPAAELGGGHKARCFFAGSGND